MNCSRSRSVSCFFQKNSKTVYPPATRACFAGPSGLKTKAPNPAIENQNKEFIISPNLTKLEFQKAKVVFK